MCLFEEDTHRVGRGGVCGMGGGFLRTRLATYRQRGFVSALNFLLRNTVDYVRNEGLFLFF